MKLKIEGVNFCKLHLSFSCIKIKLFCSTKIKNLCTKYFVNFYLFKCLDKALALFLYAHSCL